MQVVLYYKDCTLVDRAARVCRHWAEVSCYPELWETLDLSSGWIPRTHVGLRMLAELCQYKLQHTRSLNLTAWLSMTDTDLKVCTILLYYIIIYYYVITLYYLSNWNSMTLGWPQPAYNTILLCCWYATNHILLCIRLDYTTNTNLSYLKQKTRIFRLYYYEILIAWFVLTSLTVVVLFISDDLWQLS